MAQMLISRLAGTSVDPFGNDDYITDAEQEATDAFDCAINQVQECMGKLRVQQGGASDPHGCFKSALDYLSDAVRDLQFGKTKAAEEAADSVREGV